MKTARNCPRPNFGLNVRSGRDGENARWHDRSPEATPRPHSGRVAVVEFGFDGIEAIALASCFVAVS